MSRSIVLHNCTVELVIPALDVTQIGGGVRPHVKIRSAQCVEDIVVRSPILESGPITIKQLYISELRGDMLPVEEGGKVVLFTVADGVDPQHAAEPNAATPPRPECG